MRLVVMPEPGVTELSWMWMPTFIGLDSNLKREIEEHIGPQLVGKPSDDATLDWAHDLVVDFICKKHAAIPGLRDYLDAVKFVGDGT